MAILPTLHHSLHTNVQLLMGLGLVIVRSYPGKKGVAKVKVKSEGLKDEEVRVEVR